MSNCLFFALNKWFKHGGYIAIRRSRYHSFIPHIIWIKDLKDAEIEHYTPVNPKQHLISIIFHKFLFKGQIKTKDD